MELVVSRHLLDEGTAAVVLKDEEVADEGEEALRCEHAFEHYLELRYGRLCFSLVRDCPPGLEPLLPGGEGPDAGLQAVRDDEDLVHGKEGREFGLVGLELLPR